LIYKDLTKLYNYNIKDKYYVGQYEGKPLEKYGKNLNDFLNSGAILINLENLRKDNIFPKIIDFLRKNNQSLLFLDQYAINVV
jgi:lipopolysaccharide biosynthesis glycosyltransferase